MNFLKRSFKDPRALLVGDSASQNSMYLLMNNIFSSFLGFFFWLIAARFYPADDVGIAVILITASGLVSTIARFGLDMSIVKYYSESSDKKRILNTFITTITVTTTLVAIVVALFLDTFSDKLDQFQTSLPFVLLFIAISVLFNIYTVFSSVFISARKTVYYFWINSILSLSKIFLSVILTGLSSIGIFFAWGLSYLLGCCLSVVGLKRLVPGIRLRPEIDIPLIKQTANFSFANFLVNIIGNLPPYILPLLIVRFFSSADVAYYYVSFSIVSFLWAIPATTSLSLFAEVSHEKTGAMRKYVSESKRTALIILPLMVALVLFGNEILLIYGKGYSTAGSNLLSVLSLATVFIAINYFYTTHMRVTGRLVEMIVLTVIPSLGIISLSYVLMAFTNIGIAGIGWAFLISHASVSVYVVVSVVRRRSATAEPHR